MNKRLIEKIKETGLDYKPAKMTEGNEAIMVDTNYDGPYPPAETFRMHAQIREIVKRYKGYSVEARGYFTALLVKEI